MNSGHDSATHLSWPLYLAIGLHIEIFEIQFEQSYSIGQVVDINARGCGVRTRYTRQGHGTLYEMSLPDAIGAYDGNIEVLHDGIHAGLYIHTNSSQLPGRYNKTVFICFCFFLSRPMDRTRSYESENSGESRYRGAVLSLDSSVSLRGRSGLVVRGCLSSSSVLSGRRYARKKGSSFIESKEFRETGTSRASSLGRR